MCNDDCSRVSSVQHNVEQSVFFDCLTLPLRARVTLKTLNFIHLHQTKSHNIYSGSFRVNCSQQWRCTDHTEGVFVAFCGTS